MDLTCDEEMLSLSVSPGGQQDRKRNAPLGAGAAADASSSSRDPGARDMVQVTIGGAPSSLLGGSSDIALYAGLESEPVLVNDPRVLENMLQSEEQNLPSGSYFRMIQTEVTPAMRTTVSTWMFEVCEEEHVPESVFLRAITYVDRFLSIHNIQRDHFQLLGAACLLISSKWSGSVLSTERLVFYTAHSMTVSMILEWEMMILSQFKWDMFTITPSDFVEPILHKLPHKQLWDSQTLRDKIKTYNAYCATDYKFCTYPPSMIASCCIASAISSRVNRETLDEILGEINRMTTIETTESDGASPSGSGGFAIASSSSSIDQSGPSSSSTGEESAGGSSDNQEAKATKLDVLKSCMEQLQSRIQEMIRENGQSSPGADAGSSDEAMDEDQINGGNKLGELEQAETPTDVRDVHF